MPLQKLKIKDIAKGGLNTRDDPNGLMPHEVADGQDFTIEMPGFACPGAINTRAAAQTFMDAIPGSGLVRNMYGWIDEGLLMVSLTDGDIVSYNRAGVPTNRYSGTADSTWDFENMQDSTQVDTMWCLNGVDPPQQWDGVTGTTSSWTTYDAVAASAPKAFTVVAATDVFTSAGHGYSNGDRVILSGLTGGAGITAGTTYYVRDVTTNTFKIETAVGAGALNVTTDGSGTITRTFNGSMCKVWKNKLWIAGDPAHPYRLYDSPVLNPEGAYNFTDIADADEQGAITGFDIVNDNLIVFKRKSIWAVFDPTSVESRRIGGIGAWGRFMSTELDGKLYFATADGCYSTDGVDPPKKESVLIPRMCSQTPSLYRDSMRMGNARRRIYLSEPGVGAYDNRFTYELIVDEVHPRSDGTSRPSWFLHVNGFSAMTQWQPDNFDDAVLFAANDNSANLFSTFHNYGLSEFGESVSGEFRTGWFEVSGGGIEGFERLRRINVLMRGRVTVTVFGDHDTDQELFYENLGTNPDGGESPAQEEDEVVRCRPEARARWFQLYFSMTGTGNPFFDPTGMIHEVELVFRGGKEH